MRQVGRTAWSSSSCAPEAPQPPPRKLGGGAFLQTLGMWVAKLRRSVPQGQTLGPQPRVYIQPPWAATAPPPAPQANYAPTYPECPKGFQAPPGRNLPSSSSESEEAWRCEASARSVHAPRGSPHSPVGGVALEAVAPARKSNTQQRLPTISWGASYIRFSRRIFWRRGEARGRGRCGQPMNRAARASYRCHARGSKGPRQNVAAGCLAQNILGARYTQQVGNLPSTGPQDRRPQWRRLRAGGSHTARLA